MLIAIISDIHDNLVNLEKCLTWCKENNYQEIICCGDITNSETLEFLSNKFNGPIHLVKGNVEIYSESEARQYKNIKYYGKIGRMKAGNKKIGICHEPSLIDKIIKEEPCDIIFYGHTHKPWELKKGGIRLINPGTLGGMFQKATFAVWDSETGKLELKILEN